jgi:uncharacterized damage-inducible protein DinB
VTIAMSCRSSTRRASPPKNFLAVFMLALAPASLYAQDAISVPAAEEVRKHFINDLDTLHAKVLALAEAIPAEKYAWRPAEGVRSIGEALLHVASEYYVFTPLAYGATPSPLIQRTRESFQSFEKNSAKPEVLRHLKEGFDYCKKQLQEVQGSAIAGRPKLFGAERTIVETSFVMSGDLHEHLGQLIAYARMNGIKPPWSK